VPFVLLGRAVIMRLIYYTRYSIEFHCYKPLMLVGFNTVSGQECSHWPVGKNGLPLDFAAV
jgi:hypothetical protein